MQKTTFLVCTLVTYGTAMPQFGFLGNFFGGFLGNRGPTSQAAPAFGSSQAQGGRCGAGNSPNFQFGGQNYLLSWRIGCSDFTQGMEK